ncbi:MAG: hypothetical protein AAF611_17370 [Bacteroidota bacterium]
MKKKNLKSLKLNKKKVSNFNQEKIKGASYLLACETNLCTGLFGSCWCKLTVTGCPSDR